MKKDNLHNINENGFRVPKNYFETFEDQLFSELKLKETAQNPGFKAPNDYFEDLETKVMAQVSNSKTKTKVIPLFSKKNLIYVSSIAAAIILLLTLNINGTPEELDEQTVENYLLNEEISPYEIASLLEEEELTEDNFIEYTIEESTVEDYIIDNLSVEDLY